MNYYKPTLNIAYFIRYTPYWCSMSDGSTGYGMFVVIWSQNLFFIVVYKFIALTTLSLKDGASIQSMSIIQQWQ